VLRGKQHNNVHVSFDKTNPLIEHDIQDEEFKNGLVRKDLSLTVTEPDYIQWGDS